MNGLELRQFAHEMERRIFMDSNRVVVVSEAMVDFVRSLGIPRKRIVLLPNGVNPSKFYPDDSNRQIVRSKLKLNSKIVIGFVGNFRPWQDIETLIDAFCLIHSNNSDVHLLIVGDGPTRDKFEQQVQRAGLSTNVTWTGIIPHINVPAYISAMDITIAPYHANENFYFSPIKVFEYMAVGKPVVASKIGQLKKIIKNGKTGHHYETGNVKQLKNLLQELINNPQLRKRLGESARKWVTKNRTWDENVKTILETFNKIQYEDKHIKN